jgi:hypothetical protein
MVPGGEQPEDAIVADAGNGKGGEALRAMGVAGDDAEQQQRDGGFSMKSLLWHGGSVWDAWFSCASNQVQYVASCHSMPMAWHPRRVGFASVAGRGWMIGHRRVRSVLARRWRRCC